MKEVLERIIFFERVAPSVDGETRKKDGLVDIKSDRSNLRISESICGDLLGNQVSKSL